MIRILALALALAVAVAVALDVALDVAVAVAVALALDVALSNDLLMRSNTSPNPQACRFVLLLPLTSCIRRQMTTSHKSVAGLT